MSVTVFQDLRVTTGKVPDPKVFTGAAGIGLLLIARFPTEGKTCLEDGDFA